MIGYPYDYGNVLYDDQFTSEIMIQKIENFYLDETCMKNFQRGFGVGIGILGASSFFAKNVMAKYIAPLPSTGNGNTCPSVPEPGPLTPAKKPGSLTDRDLGAVTGGVATICTVAMGTGSFWVGFLCAVGVAVVVGLARGQ